MKNRNLILILFAQLLGWTSLYGQSVEGGDFMRSIGMIYVVVAVILLAFAGIVAFLINLDRRFRKIEKHIKNI